MSASRHLVTAQDLIAYLDGELDGARMRHIEGEMRTDPVLADQLADWRHQNELLHTAFDPVATRSLPASMMSVLAKPAGALTLARRKTDAPPHLAPPLVASEHATHRHGALGIACALAAAFLSGAIFVLMTGVTWAPGRPSGPQLVQLSAPVFPDAGRRMALRALETRATYQGLFADVAPPKGGTNLRTRTRGDVDKASVDSWLNAILRLEAGAPDLHDLGLTIVTARLTPSEQGPAVWLVFADADKAASANTAVARPVGRDRSVSLFVTRLAAPDSPPRYEQDAQSAAIYWTTAGLGFAVTGGREQDLLASVANSLRLNWSPAR